MRIAFVAPFGLWAKGTTRARVLPLARALVRRGHEVALFVPPYDCPEDSGCAWWEPRGDNGDTGVWVVNVALPRWGAGASWWHVRVAWRLLRAVRAWQPEWVHVFKPKGPAGLVGAAIWRLRRKSAPQHPITPRLILDSDDWEGSGGWNDDARTGYSALQRRFFAWQERFGLTHADAWTVASEPLRQRAIRLGADPARVFVVPNGVTLPEPRPAAAAALPPSVLLYTRFAGVRPADVAAIWERVRLLCPGTRLLVAGRGLTGEEAQLAGAPEAEMLGWIEPAARPALFAQTGVAVVPWTDTPANQARSSVKVRELMAAGLAIVAYAVGELPDVIGDAGILVRPGESDAFASAVAALLSDPRRAGQLGQAARRRAEAMFDWDHLSSLALRAYEVAST